MKKHFLLVALASLMFVAAAVFVKNEAVKVSVVSEQSTLAIHSQVYVLGYTSEVTLEVIPFYTPAVIGSEREGFVDDIYHPPLSDFS